MLRIYSSSKELSIGDLLGLYSEEISGDSSWQDEQEFYQYILDFLKQADSFYAVWVTDGKYASALRIEPYRDGLLLEGLVTDPMLRNRGYAKALISETIRYIDTIGGSKVYSHISRDNIPSIKTHTACGFAFLYDHSVFIDGSVDHKSNTYVFDKGH